MKSSEASYFLLHTGTQGLLVLYDSPCGMERQGFVFQGLCLKTETRRSWVLMCLCSCFLQSIVCYAQLSWNTGVGYAFLRPASPFWLICWFVVLLLSTFFSFWYEVFNAVAVIRHERLLAHLQPCGVGH